MADKTIIDSLQEQGHEATCEYDEMFKIMVYVINGEKHVTHRSQKTGYKDVYQSKYKYVFIRFKQRQFIYKLVKEGNLSLFAE